MEAEFQRKLTEVRTQMKDSLLNVLIWMV
jgi:hypothetical protein